MDNQTEHILRRRMHGLYLSRQCTNLQQLSHELLGMHCWFHRNVVFSACIRGAMLHNWTTALTKTWLYRGTLHGVVLEDLPTFLALHAGRAFDWLGISPVQQEEITAKVFALMEDGVYSRAEMRRIFAEEYDDALIQRVFSSWGGIFVYLAHLGKVAFRNMTSRDFDLISAEPSETAAAVLPQLLRRYLTAYGPATLADAAWFFGLGKERMSELTALSLAEYDCFSYQGNTYYAVQETGDMGEIPELTLLSGFDPLIVSYMDRSAVLPQEYKKAVILKSGICLPTIAVNGRVAGIWNIKKGAPELTFFAEQPRRIQERAEGLVDAVRLQTRHML